MINIQHQKDLLMNLVAQINAIKHPKAPPITIPHQTPCSPIPRTNETK